ncbi:MAG TPA: response regulator [Candidatus Eisenbacteria bacterium]|jgi:CheY-like chemotaxis protein|nr:response regulator [Candidatus Eisenbacteria bacterium]
MPVRILVVEDDAMNAKLFQLILARKAGYQVEVTEDPALVFERARSGEVDLIIMDVSLSNSEWEGKPVDGLEISRQLKRHPVSGKIPILLATAHAMKGSRENFLRASGADDYISKPIVSAEDLIQRIQALLQKRDHAVPPSAR